jgi:outer membrane protein OmpA-like peptidoglycan-associated protein
MKMKGLYFLIMITFLTTTSCNKWSRTAKGGAIGAGVGGVVGGVVGNKAGNTAAGVIIGAAVGGAAGAAIGRYMDKQAEEIQRDLKNAKVERVGEGIKITFDSGILFNVNSADLRPEAKQNIEELAKTLQKYSDTNILVEGHTDDTGTEEYNKKLSEQRAASVANFTKSLGVNGTRFSTIGYGESQPITQNDSATGRQKNRRVEVAIYANEKLKKAAKRGDI